jgi:hypothetical protein
VTSSTNQVNLSTYHLTTSKSAPSLQSSSNVGKVHRRVTHRTGAVTYRILLPPVFRRLHPVFHVSKLKIHKTSDLNPPVIAPPIDLDLDEVAEYPIMQILFTRVWGRAQIPQYRIRWDLLYRPESDKWEDAENLEECTALDCRDYSPTLALLLRKCFNDLLTL